ncbi:hypothetical protein AX14_009443, partial [Amanita brunnescens Koide BX004]
MDVLDMNCPELAERTADAITDESLHQLFVSTQMNNLDICTEFALQSILPSTYSWDGVIIHVLAAFPHFW